MPWFEDSAHDVAERASDVRVREIPGPGHLAPALEPDAVADELARFFAATPEPV